MGVVLVLVFQAKHTVVLIEVDTHLAGIVVVKWLDVEMFSSLFGDLKIRWSAAVRTLGASFARDDSLSAPPRNYISCSRPLTSNSTSLLRDCVVIRTADNRRLENCLSFTRCYR